MIPFTKREIERAWRENKRAHTDCHNDRRTNAHRLLLFYAVECGLKAVVMKRNKKDRTDLCPEFLEAQHNINKLLDILRTGTELKLPDQLFMEPLNNNTERKFTPGDINQMWRYGGRSDKITDQDIEKQLLNIVSWIEKELRAE